MGEFYDQLRAKSRWSDRRKQIRADGTDFVFDEPEPVPESSVSCLSKAMLMFNIAYARLMNGGDARMKSCSECWSCQSKTKAEDRPTSLLRPPTAPDPRVAQLRHKRNRPHTPLNLSTTHIQRQHPLMFRLNLSQLWSISTLLLECGPCMPLHHKMLASCSLRGGT